jgi:hypothetical protein
MNRMSSKFPGRRAPSRLPWEEPIRLCVLAQACYCYSVVATSYDEAWKRFLEKTKPNFDIASSDHRKALLKWLHDWGCRHIPTDRANRNMESRALKGCARNLLHELPSIERSLSGLLESGSELSLAGKLYESLRDLTVARRGLDDVKLGVTAATKTLFALRPAIFPPWDCAIRHYRKSWKSYAEYMRSVARELDEVKCEAEQAEQSHVSLDELPKRLGRSDSTSVKLVDEYNWLKATHPEWTPLSAKQLSDWQRWRPADSA